ncbi:helix-turn-helix domain-containing protein [Streptomyces sp. NPDC050856]|uniref:helix-turn-helix domain-containing protein n=1 Tax=Streptomyces sp. NPDC050856 TaxID=3154939 RepID=UPI0033E88488
MIQGELTTLGLGETEERAYRALLARRADGADELARLLRLPRERVDAALDRLVEHGFARPAVPGDGRGLPRPAAPAAAIRTLIHRRQAELHLRSAELARLRMTADRLALAGRPGPAAPGCGVEVVTGRRAIGERAGQLLAAAEREVTILRRSPGAGLGAWPATGPDRGHGAGPDDGTALAALLARGVTVRAVLERPAPAEPEPPGWLTALVDQGLRVRVATGVPAGLITVDRRVALLPPGDPADPRAAALVVGDGPAPLRDALVPLFETVWERATPLDGGRDGAVSERQQRELLALLAAGLKDEAIARRLGVHVHTARRRISRLLEALDARTRFQAGARATSLGWLEP